MRLIENKWGFLGDFFCDTKYCRTFVSNFKHRYGNNLSDIIRQVGGRTTKGKRNPNKI
jgi:hypothetical protein